MALTNLIRKIDGFGEGKLSGRNRTLGIDLLGLIAQVKTL
jgi:hypothetical protein